MKCKHCGADNFNESKFCFQCGQELSSDDVQHSEDPPVDPTHPICRNCGASNTADAKFCHQCGQELSSEAEDPEQKSDDDFGKDALAFGAGLLDEFKIIADDVLVCFKCIAYRSCTCKQINNGLNRFVFDYGFTYMRNDPCLASHILKCRNFVILIHFIRLNVFSI